MCGRYTVTPTLSQLLAGLDLDTLEVPESSEPVVQRFNVAPTQEVLTVVNRDGPQARVMRWGLIPYWSRNPKKEPLRINARSESLTERPAFKGLIGDSRSRCLVLADGWYEWLKAEDPKQPRRPVHFALTEDRRPFAFAGLWNTWKSADGERLQSCTIITGPANRIGLPIHDRMPVVLPTKAEQTAWLDSGLDAEGVAPLLGPLADELTAVHPASKRVNAATYDAPDCLDPDEDDEEEETQLTLTI
jgi:putative SOS response-associated peptidase YedK